MFICVTLNQRKSKYKPKMYDPYIPCCWYYYAGIFILQS